MTCSVILGRSVRRIWNKRFLSLSHVSTNGTVKVWALEAAILRSGCLVPTRLWSDQLQDHIPLGSKMNPLSLLRQCGEIRTEQQIFSDFPPWKATCAGVFQSSPCQPSLRNRWSLQCGIHEYGTVASSINDDPLKPSSNCFKFYMDYLCREYQHISQLVQSGEPLSESKQRELRYRITELSSIIDKQEELKDAQTDLAELNQMIEGSPDSSDKDMQELALAEKDEYLNKIEDLEEELVDLMLPSEVWEDIDILVEFTAGVGGQEAMLFTGDIFEMYKHYANYKQWKFDVLEYFNSDLGGVRHASVSISGKQAFRLMKQEAGVHRVQRVPKTEKQSRIHTSTMTVAVLPQPKEIDLNLDPKDLRVETKKASGAGGQHVNTTDSAVRVTHLPSGITAESQQERSQHKNRVIAMTLLKTRIFNHIQAAQTSSEQILRRSQVGTSARSEKIRTYNFQQDRITDHRISRSMHDVEEYLRGSELLDDMIWSGVEEEERKELRRMILDVYEKHCNT